MRQSNPRVLKSHAHASLRRNACVKKGGLVLSATLHFASKMAVQLIMDLATCPTHAHVMSSTLVPRAKASALASLANATTERQARVNAHVILGFLGTSAIWNARA